jgi:hypothetical protein
LGRSKLRLSRLSRLCLRGIVGGGRDRGLRGGGSIMVVKCATVARGIQISPGEGVNYISNGVGIYDIVGSEYDNEGDYAESDE